MGKICPNTKESEPLFLHMSIDNGFIKFISACFFHTLH